MIWFPRRILSVASAVIIATRDSVILAKDTTSSVRMLSPWCDSVCVADDPRIQNTIAVIDALLRVETPNGPSWHRYNGDGYGEHEDGSPFDGTGTGRLWRLLTGERGHYELAAGRPEAAEKLLRAMKEFANEGGLLPEQVWDTADISERGLRFGGPA